MIQEEVKVERAIFRGEIYYAELEQQVIGSEQTGARPVLILQNNIGNEFSPTIIVAPITSKTYYKTKMPTHIYIKVLIKIQQYYQSK